MSTTKEYIEFVCEQVRGIGDIRYRKMFGEYLVYINEKPVFLVCDNTVYVKKSEAIRELMHASAVGVPYDGAREHYILDIDDPELTKEVAGIIVLNTAPSKRRTKNPS